MKNMKKPALVLISTLMASTGAHAAESAPYSPDQMVNPNAQYTYAETAECMHSIGIYSNMTGTTSKVMGNAATAMLGRLPACEVEKIILVGGGSEDAKKWIMRRKLDAKKSGQ